MTKSNSHKKTASAVCICDGRRRKRRSRKIILSDDEAESETVVVSSNDETRHGMEIKDARKDLDRNGDGGERD